MMNLQCSVDFPPPTMNKIHQNIAELLNCLLSPMNLLVARGNNWSPRVINNESSMICRFPPPTMNKIPQNMAELLISLLSPINLLVAKGNNW